MFKTKTLIVFYAIVLISLILTACSPSATVMPTLIPATAVPVLPTATVVPPTATHVPATATPIPVTPLPSPTLTSTPDFNLSGSGGGVVAFAAEASGSLEIYLMNADGSDRRRVTFDGRNNGWTTWSPDGKQLAYHSVQGSSSVLKRITLQTGQIETWPIPMEGYVWEPAWSHDGQWIAFSAQTTGSSSDIYKMTPDGKQIARLTKADGFNGGPFWSPDDKQIAFYSNRDGNFEVYVMQADGSGQRRLTNNPADDLLTAWSPDGTRLAFFSKRDGNENLYTINADGSNLTQLTNHPGDESYPIWLPDGKQIAFVSNRDGNLEIYVAPLPAKGGLIDDASVRRLTNSPGRDLMPVWRPVK